MSALFFQTMTSTLPSSVRGAFAHREGGVAQVERAAGIDGCCRLRALDLEGRVAMRHIGGRMQGLDTGEKRHHVGAVGVDQKPLVRPEPEGHAAILLGRRQRLGGRSTQRLGQCLDCIGVSAQRQPRHGLQRRDRGCADPETVSFWGRVRVA